MSAELSPPPAIESQVPDPGLFDRLRDRTADACMKLGRLAGSTLLVAGSTLAITAAEEVVAPNPAFAYDANTGDYPWWDASHVPKPPAQDNYTWGYTSKATCDDKSVSYDCSSAAIGGYYFRDQWGFDLRNCTSYAAWRVATEFGANASGLGSATTWNNRASSKGWSVDTTPEVGDIAQFEGDDNNPYADPGHVAFVTEVRADGSVVIDEYNQRLDGKFRFGRVVRASSYIDVNGPNPAGFKLKVGTVNNGPGSGGSNPAKTHMLLDGLDRVQARDTIGEQGWVEETDPGGAKDIATGGGVQLILDHAGRVWSRNTLGKEGWRKETENPDSAVEIEMGSDGTMMLRDHASQIYAKKYGSSVDWVREAGPGSAKDIETNGGVQVLRDYADQIWIKNGGISWGGWWPASEQYYAQELEVGTDSTIMVRRYDDSVFTRKEGDWVRESWPGGAAEIATNGGLRVVRNYAGEVWQKSGPLHTEGWQPDAASGSAVELQVTDDGTRLIRDHINRIYARGMGPNDQYVPETGPNSAVMIGD